ncbi:MAG: hypothetical protein CMM08_08715, partial [Rhodospirillaceae bacterium]|nr:hypothetical protein [Rhodospirillaceae bacterium]
MWKYLAFVGAMLVFTTSASAQSEQSVCGDRNTFLEKLKSYCQKLVMRISGGAFDQLFSVLEFDASDDLHQ